MTARGEVRAVRGENARVRVYRGTACGEGCASCGGCAGRRPVEVTARNPVGAVPGDQVEVESATGRVLGIAVLVYLVPLAAAVCAYLLGRAFGGSDDAGALAALGGFLVGLLPALLRGRRKISYTITNKIS